MAASTAGRREQLRVALIAAAERAVATGGLEALKARTLALEVGCSLGAIYNVFPNLDALALAVNQRTLEAFSAALGASPRLDSSGPAAELKRRALAYADFAAAHPQRWRALFDHAVNAGSSPFGNSSSASAVSRLFEGPLSELMADGEEARRFAHALLAGIQGIVQLALEEMPTDDSIRDEVERLVAVAALGLTAWGSGKPPPQPFEQAR